MPLDIDRSITEIEQNIIEGVIKLALEDLREVWRRTVELRIRIEARETSPQLIQIVAPNEVVVVIVFEVKIGDVSGMINLCIPSSMMEPIAGKFDHEWTSGGPKTDDPENIKKIKYQILRTKQPVNADITGSSININELLNLESDDLVLLNYDGKSDILLSVKGVPKLSGTVVEREKQRAFVISGLLDASEVGSG
jgi:flagellar motor switch protein FliM